MAFRNLTRAVFQFGAQRRLLSVINRPVFQLKPTMPSNTMIFRSFASAANTENAYRDVNEFLHKEIQLEKSMQKHPNNLPQIKGFEVKADGPHVTLTRQAGQEKITVEFNVTNTVDSSASEVDTGDQQQQNATEAGSQLKSRPSFTVDINRGGQTLSFMCSFLADDYPNPQEQQENDGQPLSEDFQIDEFAIHDGEWNEKVYSADCSVIDSELYDKLLNLLEEHGIGEEFAEQLMNYSTAYEHRQYIDIFFNNK